MKISIKKYIVSFLFTSIIISMTACSSTEQSYGNVNTQSQTETFAEEHDETVGASETVNAAATENIVSTEAQTGYPDYDDSSPLISEINRGVGDYMIFSSVSNGGYVARLVLSDIIHTPDGELNAYQAMGKVQLELLDAREGHPMTNGITSDVFAVPELQSGMTGSGIWADCAENALEIYEFKWNGNTKYLLRAYMSYGSEDGAYSGTDPNLYHARFFICDGDVCASEGRIVPYEIKRDANGTVYTKNKEGSIEISDSLVYKGENVFYDEKQDMEIMFDPIMGTATYRIGVSS